MHKNILLFHGITSAPIKEIRGMLFAFFFNISLKKSIARGPL